MAFPTTEEIRRKVDQMIGGGGEAPITCQCGASLKRMTCNKEGPNKGRQFYSCRDPNCRLFQWADEAAKKDAPRTPSKPPSQKRQRQDIEDEGHWVPKRRKDDDDKSDFAAAAERLAFESKQQRDLLQSIIEALKMSMGMLGEIKLLLDVCPKSCISPDSTSGDEQAPLLNAAPQPITRS